MFTDKQVKWDLLPSTGLPSEYCHCIKANKDRKRGSSVGTMASVKLGHCVD